MQLHNETDEHVKVCIYNTSETLDVIPLPGGVVFLEPHQSQTWQPADEKKEVDVRFFNPQLLDRLLARAAKVSPAQRVRLYRDKQDYKAAVTASA